MTKRICKTALLAFTALFAVASVTSPLSAQTTSADANATAPAKPDKATTAQPAAVATLQAADTKTSQSNEAEMMAKMMELSKLNDNHKMLASMAGTWSYTVKMWMDPSAKPTESTGTAVRKAVMDGRFVTGEYSGKFKMPGADGKMVEMNFKGMSLDGYDNEKQKFVSTWVDNMGTGVMMCDGTYDASTKSFTYTGEYEPMPGMKCKIRQVIKSADKDHMSMEYYEDRGAGEMKTMEINYSRKK
jgi:hypothetical protein